VTRWDETGIEVRIDAVPELIDAINAAIAPPFSVTKGSESFEPADLYRPDPLEDDPADYWKRG
jgi:hypothetical protein